MLALLVSEGSPNQDSPPASRLVSWVSVAIAHISSSPIPQQRLMSRPCKRGSLGLQAVCVILRGEKNSQAGAILGAQHVQQLARRLPYQRHSFWQRVY